MTARSRWIGSALGMLLAGWPALAGSIAGRLLDPAGQPIAGAKVQWLPHRDDDQAALDRTSNRDPSPLGETSTDAQGRFRAVLDRPGAISLRIFAPGHPSIRLAGPYDPADDTAL